MNIAANSGSTFWKHKLGFEHSWRFWRMPVVERIVFAGGLKQDFMVEDLLVHSCVPHPLQVIASQDTKSNPQCSWLWRPSAWLITSKAGISDSERSWTKAVIWMQTEPSGLILNDFDVLQQCLFRCHTLSRNIRKRSYQESTCKFCEFWVSRVVCSVLEILGEVSQACQRHCEFCRGWHLWNPKRCCKNTPAWFSFSSAHTLLDCKTMWSSWFWYALNHDII